MQCQVASPQGLKYRSASSSDAARDRLDFMMRQRRSGESKRIYIYWNLRLNIGPRCGAVISPEGALSLTNSRAAWAHKSRHLLARVCHSGALVINDLARISTCCRYASFAIHTEREQKCCLLIAPHKQGLGEFENRTQKTARKSMGTGFRQKKNGNKSELETERRPRD